MTLAQAVLPRRAPALDARRARERSRATLAKAAPQSPLDEVQQQNQELLARSSELRAAPGRAVAPQRELEDTNRGVVALYAELDEKADHLRRADELKSRFLSNMSHEFRTPLNSILALSRLLLDAARRRRSPPSRRGRWASSARPPTTCSELVNDLLDLAKVEAGKIGRPAGRVRRRRTCSARCAACCARCCVERVGGPRLRGARGPAAAVHRRGARSRRSCATSSRTR